MDDIHASLSQTKKKFKHILTGRKRKPDGTGTNPGEEGAGSTNLLPQPEPHVVVGENYDREGDKADAAGEPVFSMDRPPQPDGLEFVPTRGSDNGQEGGEVDIDGGETSKNHSHPHSDVGIVVGSRRSGGREGAHPSPSTLLISHSGTPDGT